MRLRGAAAFLAMGISAGLALQAAAATEQCGICATTVTTNSVLAQCFLERYDRYAARTGLAIVIDLSDCPADRGVVEALSTPSGNSVQPDLQFILARNALSCFRDRLNQPDAELDPMAMISLEGCP